MTTFIDVVKQYLLSAPREEIVILKELFDKIPSNLDLREVVINHIKEKERLIGVKHIKDITGLSLLEAKEYFENIEKQYYQSLNQQ